MASPVEKITIQLKEFHDKIKSKIYDGIVMSENVCELVKENFPFDCILMAERKEVKAHKTILQAVSPYLKVILNGFAILWL
jgi:BTB/POZ domain